MMTMTMMMSCCADACSTLAVCLPGCLLLPGLGVRKPAASAACRT